MVSAATLAAAPPAVRLPAASPAVYSTLVRHVRTGPVRNDFTYRGQSWLVDLDALPQLPRIARPFASFDARDHAGDPTRSLRENLDDYLASRGIDLAGGRVLMLTSPRTLGYAFNPLTVYWCHDRTGSLRYVVAEVHNTYGGRHRYLLTPDERGACRTDKEFYVSPFYEVAGHYTMSLPEPGETLALRITLHPPGGPPFVATVRGRRRSSSGFSLTALALSHPFGSLAVSARIRRQGIGLYLRGLPVIPRRSSSPAKEPG